MATRTHLIWAVACLAFIVGLLSLPSAYGESFGTKIDAGGRECYTEVVEAGGTIAFNFRVTDGGSFDIDASMEVLFTPAMDRATDMDRVHFNDFFMARRDRRRTKVLHTWPRASSGGHTYTAPSATESKHGLPVDVTICFDNSFSTMSPKWVSFTLMKHDVLEIDPDAVNKVESEMEQRLHGYGKTMFRLAQDADALRLTAAADRSRNYSTSYILTCALILNLTVFALMAVYQYWALTKFMKKVQRKSVSTGAAKPVTVVTK